MEYNESFSDMTLDKAIALGLELKRDYAYRGYMLSPHQKALIFLANKYKGDSKNYAINTGENTGQG